MRKHPPLAATPPRESHYNGSGQRVTRKSSDSAWPLRRADGLTYGEARLKGR